MTDKPNTFVGLDMGGAQTRCLVAVANGGQLRYLSCGVMPPARWDEGDTAAEDATADSVYEVIREAEESGGVTIVSAVVGVGASGVASHLVHTGVTLPVGEGKIRSSDVQAVLARAERGLVHRGTTALQLVPLEFAAGPSSGLRDPIGYLAGRLEAFVRVVLMRKSDHDSICAMVKEAGIGIEDTVLGGFAAATGTLTQAEMIDGVAHIDFGKVASSLTVYRRGRLRLAIGLPIGRDDLLEDIASSLKTSTTVASSLITDFGRIEFDLGKERASVFVPGPDPKDPVGSGAMRSCNLLNRIITRRVNDCLEMAHSEIRKISMGGDSVRSVVLTGDMAALPGIQRKARSALSLGTRVGLPCNLHDLPPELRHPGWACAAGAVLYAHQLAYWQERNTDKQERLASGLRQEEVVLP